MFSAEQLVTLCLSLPIWTLISLYLLLLLILYLKSLQYFDFYDRCDSSNCHFQYNFELVVGRPSNNLLLNYPNEAMGASLIVDLLDNHQVSMMTIQVPSSTVFRDNQLVRLCDCPCCSMMSGISNGGHRLKKIAFTVYRKIPLKDVRSVRLAHSFLDHDSRLIVYGFRLHDKTNKEVKFFPIQTVVRHRGSQWALNSNFEPNSELTFAKMGADPYDPFEHPTWPTYFELLLMLFFVWCSSYFFAYIIGPKSLLPASSGSGGSSPDGKIHWQLHSLVVFCCSSACTLFLSLVFMLLIKTNSHSDSLARMQGGRTEDTNQQQQQQQTTASPRNGLLVRGAPLLWPAISCFFKLLVLMISLGFVMSSLKQRDRPHEETHAWLKSSVLAATCLSFLLLAIYIICRFVKLRSDRKLLNQRDELVLKSNSKPNLFDPSLAPKRTQMQAPKRVSKETTASNSSPTKNSAGGGTQNNQQQQHQAVDQQHQKENRNSNHSKQQQQQQHHSNQNSRRQHRHRSRDRKSREDRDELKAPKQASSKDNLESGNPMSDNLYIKTKNKNSISQYV